MESDDSRGPRHVGIILDGNRRYARRLGLPQIEGHLKGFENLKAIYKDFTTEAKDYGISELSLYCFSMQNFHRSKEEVDYLMNIFGNAFNEAAVDKNVHKNKIRINVIGRIHLLPEKLQKAVKKAMDATKGYDKFTINFCLAYGGREEIADAAKKLAKEVKDGKVNVDDINETVFGKYLYNNSDLDLVIRTSGEMRTSNFLPWQTSYAEWFFVEKTWPEFSIDDLKKILEDFKLRKRRFGGN